MNSRCLAQWSACALSCCPALLLRARDPKDAVGKLHAPCNYNCNCSERDALPSGQHTRCPNCPALLLRARDPKDAVRKLHAPCN
ncbi:hypothetical protein CEXT_552531 [Caerostris extrusa]|uniref:Secreted protein n=1 Tax=Caerostris extrusa TaxID=172846 RepID=A0AAV4YCS2_CAEEX|nr:hypothetical protein CEXT_552531 [Caerostris extrusa]